MTYNPNSPASLDLRALAVHNKRKKAMREPKINKSEELPLETIREKRFRILNGNGRKKPQNFEENSYNYTRNCENSKNNRCNKSTLFQNYSYHYHKQAKQRSSNTINKSFTEKKSNPHRSFIKPALKPVLSYDSRDVPTSRQSIAKKSFCENKKLHSKAKNGSIHKRKIKNYKLKEISRYERKKINHLLVNQKRVQRKVSKGSSKDQRMNSHMDEDQCNLVDAGSCEGIQSNPKELKLGRGTITCRHIGRNDLSKEILATEPCTNNFNEEIGREIISEIINTDDISMEEEKSHLCKSSIRKKCKRELSMNSDAQMESEDILQGRVLNFSKNSFWSFQNNKNLKKTRKPLQLRYMRNYGEMLLERYLLREKDIRDPLLGHSISRQTRGKVAKWIRNVCESLKTTQTCPRLYSLAMYIFDYLLWSQQGKDSITNQNIHLISVVSIFMASKFEEVEPLKLKYVYKNIAHKEFSKNKIIITERNILKIISTLSFVIAYDFVALITENLQTFTPEEEAILKLFIEQCNHRLEECIIHPYLSQFKPSTLSIICLNLALNEFAQKTTYLEDVDKENINISNQEQSGNARSEYLKCRVPFTKIRHNRSRPVNSLERLKEELRIRATSNCAYLAPKKTQNSSNCLKKKLVRRWRSQISKLEEYGMTMPDIERII
ncbi:unnamed protein product [Moneuplotes crassus]|uniref:Cyclin-like domain-containing protein n=1 Tax=Euplotes crassus TaxID=5936 RepID=A0AAD2DAF6_EUPCR|nr:unnamed protein product [Moneuplotes crassus]